jgi:uncharacterized NAD(P)/FAD-binding protein YdhS
VIRTNSGLESFEAARVINCTGPDMNYRRLNSPLFKSLFEQGLVTVGPLGEGFNSTRSGAIINVRGEASGTLFNLGPGRLGTLLESIAIPEIRQQAVELAMILATRVSEPQLRPQPIEPPISAPACSTAATMASA